MNQDHHRERWQIFDKHRKQVDHWYEIGSSVRHQPNILVVNGTINTLTHCISPNEVNRRVIMDMREEIGQSMTEPTPFGALPSYLAVTTCAHKPTSV